MSTSYAVSVPDKDRIITVTPVSNTGRAITIVPVGSITIPRPPSGGKRGAVAPLVTTSDEDDSGPDSPRSESTESRSAMSPGLLHDHDYENINSPGSTASGPTYVRQPGFTHHAHSVTKSKVKKKKSGHPGTTAVTPASPQVITVKEAPSSSSSSSTSSSHCKKQQQEPQPPKSKHKQRGKPHQLILTFRYIVSLCIWWLACDMCHGYHLCSKL